MRQLDAYLEAAVAAGASDLHIEPASAGALVRMRVDGHLRPLEPPPSGVLGALCTRARLLAGVDLAERRLPQDGRFAFACRGRTIDVRASFMPVYGGEKITLRLLDRDRAALSLEQLGMENEEQLALRRALGGSGGMIAVCGPTGSGKTTTLYAALEVLRRPDRSLLTVEDPVERRIDGVAQVSVDEACGRSFATALRHALRQDPDVLMIGEVRDPPSARIACRAALTGHVVLTTVHASDASEAFVRLEEMGIPRYLLAATVRLVVAQRLVRMPCPQCSRKRALGDEERALFRAAALEPPDRVPAARGCSDCGMTGYRGRTGVFEMQRQIRGQRERVGYPCLLAAGLARVARGMTTMAEVLAQCPCEGESEPA
ncbi:MAG: type II/IV secretion system protein [Candidatus Dadabacteria bacterium]|nr:MAG: type II/IV secretion system protein [Candidatus Dadabacteria bacterium]